MGCVFQSEAWHWHRVITCIRGFQYLRAAWFTLNAAPLHLCFWI